MKKMKRFLVALLSCLTAVACVAGISACKDEKPVEDNSANQTPSYDINVDLGGEEVCAHDYQLKRFDGTSCEEEGLGVLACVKCGKTAVGEDGEEYVKLPATGHKITIVEQKDATCTEAGVKTTYAKCETCGLISLPTSTPNDFEWIRMEESLLVEEAKGHTWSTAAVPALPKTCTEDGYDSFVFCTVCFNKAVADVEFKLENPGVTTAANVLADKDLRKEFFIDGKIATIGWNVQKASHTMVKFFTSQNADTYGATKKGDAYIVPASETVCGANGIENFEYCAKCKTSEFASVPFTKGTTNIVDYVKALKAAGVVVGDYKEIQTTTGHNYVTAAGVDTYVAGIDATCTEAGYTESFTCSTCGLVKNATVIPAKGHSTGKTGDTVATCAAKAHCSVCNEDYGEKLACTNTTYVSVTATCTKSGYTATYCKDCKTINYTSYTPATGHSFNEVAATVATCTSAATVAHYKCTACGQLAQMNVDQNQVKSVGGYLNAVPTTGSALGHHIYNTADTAQTKIELNNINGLLVNALNAHYNANTATNNCANFTMPNYACKNNCGWSVQMDTNNHTWYLDKNGNATNYNGAAYVLNGQYYNANEIPAADMANAKIRTYIIPNGVPANCTTAAKCGICKVNYGSALGHKFITDTTDANYANYYVAQVNATCAPNGNGNGCLAYYKCANNCGVVSENGYTQAYRNNANGVSTPVTTTNVAELLKITTTKEVGHAWVDVALKLPTCAEAGYYAHKMCADCKYVDIDGDGTADAASITNTVKAIAKRGHVSTATGSCAPQVVCDKCYFTVWNDLDNDGVIDEANEVSGWMGCGTTITNTQVSANHVWVNGECDICKITHTNHSYTDALDIDCNVCGKKRD